MKKLLIAAVGFSFFPMAQAEVISSGEKGDCSYELKINEDDNTPTLFLEGIRKQTAIGLILGRMKPSKQSTFLRFPEHAFPLEDGKEVEFEPFYNQVVTYKYNARTQKLVYKKQYTSGGEELFGDKTTIKIAADGSSVESFYNSAHATFGTSVFLQSNKLTYTRCRF